MQVGCQVLWLELIPPVFRGSLFFVMGSCCSSCFNAGSREELLSPADLEIRRRQQAEAAENRAKLSEARGLAHPGRVQRKIEQAREREERMEKAVNATGGPTLKV